MTLTTPQSRSDSLPAAGFEGWLREPGGFDSGKLPQAETALQGGAGFSTLLGVSAALRRTRQLLSKAIDSHCPVLLRAETGMGAAQVARAIHYAGPRRGGPFLTVNCAHQPECVQEPELFGDAAAAPDSAGRPGLLALAAGGTLFLDGVSHLSPTAQARLLRHLDQGEFAGAAAAGGAWSARVVAATHRDLERDVEAGGFSPQLFLRLGVVNAQIPPLRQRVEDIPVLAHHFLAAVAQRTGRSPRGFAPGAVDLLARYPWPGNVRELKRAVEAAAARARDGDRVEIAHLSPEIRQDAASAGRCQEGEALNAAIRRVKRGMIEQALIACGGNRTRAAQRLGMSRPNLQKTMKRLGIR